MDRGHGSCDKHPAGFLLLGALTVTSCLMGPDCLFEVHQHHQEPCNIFTACLCEAGTGKTQAYKVAVEDPIQSLPTKDLVHDYTSKGLIEHLKTRACINLSCGDDQFLGAPHETSKRGERRKADVLPFSRWQFKDHKNIAWKKH